MEENCEKTLLELDHLFRKTVRKFVKERDKITIEGISLPSMMILRKILLSGEQRLSDLAEEMDLTSGAITAQCDKLEELGLADRIRYKGDRRTIYLNITEQGKAFMERYSHIGFIHASTIFQGLSPQELEQQLHIYSKLIDNLEGLSEKIVAAAQLEQQPKIDEEAQVSVMLEQQPKIDEEAQVSVMLEQQAEALTIASSEQGAAAYGLGNEQEALDKALVQGSYDQGSDERGAQGKHRVQGSIQHGAHAKEQAQAGIDKQLQGKQLDQLAAVQKLPTKKQAQQPPFWLSY